MSDVRAALMKIRPFDAPGRAGPGRAGPAAGHHDGAMPLRQLARALGVSRADLRDAFRQLRAGVENDWKQEQQALAKFLADRFNLDVSTVQDALAAAGAATKVTASRGTTRPSHSSLRRRPPPSPTGGGSSSRTRRTPTPRLASGSHGPPRA